MEEIIDIILQAVDNASEVFTGVIDSATEMGDSIQEGADGAADSLDNVETEAEEAKESMDAMADLMAFQAISEYVNQLADAMWQLADKAGTVQDSWTRMGLAAEGAGIPIEQMKSSVSSLAEETGRAGGSIRESFISMSSAGVTELSAMEDVFKGASAQAFILGTDVESLTSKFAGMAMKSSIAERTLKGTGVTVEELGQVLGIQGATIDDVNAKWETMDVDARAAALGQAAAMNEGKDANDAYKNSWEGLQAQVDKAKSKLEVMVGNVLLPVLIPALQAAGRILDWLGDTLEGVMNGPLGDFISVIGSLAGGFILAFAAITAVKAGMGFFAASLWPAITASWALLAPWLPWIAIGAAIVLIIYEIGKAFGWWTDASSMIDAIGAGLQRLWDAFINHPDVQAAIQAITDAWNWLVPAVQGAWNAVMEFFGISTSGDFDIVRALIDGIGAAWKGLKPHIEIVIGIVTTVIEVFKSIVSAGEDLYNGLSEVWDGIMGFLTPYITTITGLVEGLISIFEQFKNGQIDLPTAVIMAVSLIWNAWLTIVTQIISLVLRFAGQLLTYAIQAGSNFLNGIITHLSRLPSRVTLYLLVVLNNIITLATQWVSNAVSKASSLVSQVGSTLSGLPGRISSALSGVVNAIVKPFQDAYNRVAEEVDKIKNKASEITGIAFGGETAYAGEGLLTSDYSIGESSINVDVNEHITLDLVNVPAHIDTDTLINMLSDRNVLRALTSNRTFQDLDSQVKNEILRKSLRANGG